MSLSSSRRPRRKPVQERSRETVAVILEAAAQVFARRGYGGATTNHIAARAGVSVGSIYQYFPNKEAILARLLERHIEDSTAVATEMLAALDARPAGPEPLPVDLLRPFVVRVVALHAAEPELHRVLLLEAPRLPELVERLHRVEEGLASAASRLLSRLYGLSARSADRMAYVIIHVVELLAHEYVTHPPADVDEAAFVDELVAMLAAYVESRR